MNQREASKLNFSLTGKDQATLEEINSGSLQRIADATEKMASNYQKMENDLEMYKRWYFEKIGTINKMERRISSMKGVITKLKNKLNHAK